MKITDIVYENGEYWVLRVPYGYEVYKTGITVSTRCSRIGYKGQKGLDKAIAEITRRQIAES